MELPETENYAASRSKREIPEGNLVFAVPKKGRLNPKVLKVLEGAGLEYVRHSRRDIAHCVGMPVTLVFLPAADIAKYVGAGNVDMGITGEDIVAETLGESGHAVTCIESLGFGKCVLAVQAPKGTYDSAKEIAGGRVVTSFPYLARKYFQKLDSGSPTKIETVSGSVEVACEMGLADAVIDLVETGTTMRAAGLEILDVVMQTQAVLIANPHSEHMSLVSTLAKRVNGYMTATRNRIIQYNISREKLSEALKITPGKRSATVSRLENDEDVAVSAMIRTADGPNIMDRLEAIGATDIFILGLENCRT